MVSALASTVIRTWPEELTRGKPAKSVARAATTIEVVTIDFVVVSFQFHQKPSCEPNLLLANNRRVVNSSAGRLQLLLARRLARISWRQRQPRKLSPTPSFMECASASSLTVIAAGKLIARRRR